MERWQNKVAVVTGASSGIGAAIVKAFLENGLKVVGLARRVHLMEEIQKKLPQKQKENYVFFKCDVANALSVNEAFDKIIEIFGGIDILVNNAGVMNTGPILTMDVRLSQEIFDVNLMGVIHCTQRAFQSMKERSFGHIFVINSVAGHHVPCFPKEIPPMFSTYVVSKSGLKVMTEMLRQELLHFDTKIKITSISPGLVDTDMLNDFLRTAAGGNFLNLDDITSSVLYALSTPPHVQVHELTVKPVGEFTS